MALRERMSLLRSTQPITQRNFGTKRENRKQQEEPLMLSNWETEKQHVPLRSLKCDWCFYLLNAQRFIQAYLHYCSYDTEGSALFGKTF